MDVRPILDPHGRQWRASPLTFIRHGLGPLSPILLGFLICLLLWLLEQDASLKQVAAGIAIFLFGMFFLEQGFGQLLSGQWRRGLRQLTASGGRSFTLGFLATLLTQSSALIAMIALLLLSFLSAGMVDFLASIAIMAGASLGTTSGGWLMASMGLKLSIGDYALPMLVVGYQLSHANFKAALQGISSWVTLVLRLLVLPLTSLGICLALNVSHDLTLVLLIAASAPPAALLSMFAARFGKDTALTSSLVSVQTAISALTMPVLVGLAEVLG